MNVGGEAVGKGRSRDFDLNLAPIIDCFTVLIAFMLISSSFLAIGVIDSATAVQSSTSDPNAKVPPVNLEIHLSTARELRFKVTGKEKVDRPIAAVKGDWNLTELTTEVEALKKRWPDTKVAVLVPDNTVGYLQLVRVMESLKAHMPGVLLGGF